MADSNGVLPLLGLLLDAALHGRWDAPAFAERIAGHAGIDPDAGPQAAERALRTALGLTAKCRCGITRGAPCEVIPVACPVHGTPCGECGGLEACKPGCGDGYAPVDSGSDADGTPWSVAAGITGMVVSVGAEDVLLKGGMRDRFAEAVARAVTPGQAEAAPAAGVEG